MYWPPYNNKALPFRAFRLNKAPTELWQLPLKPSRIAVTQKDMVHFTRTASGKMQALQTMHPKKNSFIKILALLTVIGQSLRLPPGIIADLLVLPMMQP